MYLQQFYTQNVDSHSLFRYAKTNKYENLRQLQKKI